MMRLLLACLLALAGCPGEVPPGSPPPPGCDDGAGCPDAAPAAVDARAPAPDASPSGAPDAPPSGAPDSAPPPPPGADATPAGCYSEPVFPEADVSDLRAAFTGGNWQATAFGVLARRWPAGHALLQAEAGDPQLAGFFDASSFAALMESLMTAVHEETHGWDYEQASWGTTFAYWLRADLTPQVPWIDGFPRSEVRPLLEDGDTSLYAGTYLAGEQGTRGFVELMDELNCYVNGMAALAVVGEFQPTGISARDGAVAFLYYLELYLRRARTAHPDVYAELQADAAIVELVRVEWLRAHFFLAIADAHPRLGIADADIREHLYAPANQAEIELFLGHPVAASSCLP